MKSRETQKVFFTDRNFYWLSRYLASRTDKNPALFVSQGIRLDREVSRSRMRRQFEKIGESLGIKKAITHHIFRKSFVTHLLQRKADIMAVKDLARHRSRGFAMLFPLD